MSACAINCGGRVKRRLRRVHWTLARDPEPYQVSVLWLAMISVPETSVIVENRAGATGGDGFRGSGGHGVAFGLDGCGGSL
jgi:hypothetical protein